MQTNHNHVEKHLKHKCKNYGCYMKLCGKWSQKQPNIEQSFECNYFSFFSFFRWLSQVWYSPFPAHFLHCCSLFHSLQPVPHVLLCSQCRSQGCTLPSCRDRGGRGSQSHGHGPLLPLGAVDLSLVRLCPVLCAGEQQLRKTIQKRCFCNAVICLG